MGEKLKYIFYRGFFTAIAWLPFPLLYVLSDFLRFILENVMHYRSKIVRENLRNSFPEKSDEELREIEKDFYSQFADNIVETAKLLHMSDKQADERIKVVGADMVNESIRKGHSVILYLGHYANWEYVPAINRHFHGAKRNAQVYKPLRDKAFDKLMLKVRSRFKTQSIPQAKVFRTLLGWHRDNEPFITGFIADHRSNSSVSHHSTIFLNQSTPFNPGGEEIGKRVDARYFYVDVEKLSRGHYMLTFVPIVPDSLEGDAPYTRKYLEMLEGTIRRRPGLWLWSHRRWLYQ